MGFLQVSFRVSAVSHVFGLSSGWVCSLLQSVAFGVITRAPGPLPDLTSTFDARFGRAHQMTPFDIFKHQLIIPNTCPGLPRPGPTCRIIPDRPESRPSTPSSPDPARPAPSQSLSTRTPRVGDREWRKIPVNLDPAPDPGPRTPSTQPWSLTRPQPGARPGQD